EPLADADPAQAGLRAERRQPDQRPVPAGAGQPRGAAAAEVPPPDPVPLRGREQRRVAEARRQRAPLRLELAPRLLRLGDEPLDRGHETTSLAGRQVPMARRRPSTSAGTSPS